MKVWKIKAPGDIEREEITDAETPVGYAKVKLVRTAISLSDLNLYRGASPSVLPIVPGHQAVGIVSEIGENDVGLEKGQRVVIESYRPCGKCADCKNGNPERCAEIGMLGLTEDGLLRDFAVVPIDNLYQLPSHIKDDEAIFTEHIAMAVRIFHELDVQKGDHIAVVGSSIIGLVLAQIALYYQAIPVLVSSAEYHEQAAKATGIYYFVNAAKDNAVQRIAQITGGRGCERVAFLTSSNESFSNALDYAGTDAKLCVAGWKSEKPLPCDLSKLVSKRLSVSGINNAMDYTTVAINLLANKAVDVAPLISKIIEFDDVPEMFRDASENPYHYNKVLVRI